MLTTKRHSTDQRTKRKYKALCTAAVGCTTHPSEGKSGPPYGVVECLPLGQSKLNTDPHQLDLKLLPDRQTRQDHARPRTGLSWTWLMGLRVRTRPTPSEVPTNVSLRSSLSPHWCGGAQRRRNGRGKHEGRLRLPLELPKEGRSSSSLLAVGLDGPVGPQDRHWSFSGQHKR